MNGSELTTEKLSACLTSTQNNLRVSKLRIQRARERFPYEVLSTFIFLTVLMVFSVFTLIYGVWWVGLLGLLSVFFSVSYLIKSRNHSTGFKYDWIYTFILKLRLKLWKIPLHDDEKINPRCIFVPWNENQTGTWGEWLYTIILPKLQSELGITDMNGLDSIIKNAEYSSNKYQSYSLWRDGVMIPRSPVPMWLFLLLGNLSLVLITIVAIYHESNIAKFVSLPGVAADLKMIYGLVKSNNENVEPDVEANVNIFDVICRLHRAMKKETLFFAVVTKKRDALKDVQPEYKRYFKLVIICDEKILRYHLEKCNYIFNMKWLQYNETSDKVKDPVADIIFDCIIYKRFKSYSVDAENMLEFLRLLHKINNDNNRVVTNRAMLHLVDGGTTLSYSETNPESIGLNLFSNYRDLCFEKISHSDLPKLMIDILKKSADKNHSNAPEVILCFNNCVLPGICQ